MDSEGVYMSGRRGSASVSTYSTFHVPVVVFMGGFHRHDPILFAWGIIGEGGGGRIGVREGGERVERGVR